MRMTPINMISIKFVTGIDHIRVGTHHLLSFLPGSDPVTVGELLYASPTNFQINIALQHRPTLHTITLIHELIHVLLFLISPSLRPHKTYDRLWLTIIEPTYLLLAPKDKP